MEKKKLEKKPNTRKQKQAARKKCRQVAWGRVGGAVFVLILLCTSIFWACSSSDSEEVAEPEQPVVEETKPALKAPAFDAELDKKADEILAKMSRTEKIGQLMMIGIQGTDVNDDSLYMFRQFHFGGVILFDRNMKDKEQVASLTKALQSQCDEKVPLFVAIDEEGGDVARMTDVLTPPPSQQSLGSGGNPNQARKSAYDISQELKKMGINVNFAPVADIGSMGSRHFSTDPSTASDFVAAAAAGYDEAGMFFALKHFPGIGRGTSDSHQDTVVVDVARETIESEDMMPFKRIIENYKPENFFVMVSHLTYPQIDGNTPASISTVIMKDMLRNELGYQGVIVTDDMEMGAIANHYGFRRAAVEAIKAGADVVLMCHEYQHEEEAYMGILDALNSGEISEAQIDECAKRVIRMKLSRLQ